MVKSQFSGYKVSVGLILALFLFNYVSSKLIDIIQSNQPSAYRIATGSLGKFIAYFQQNWLAYGMTLVGYLVIWVALILLVSTVMLMIWGMVSKKNYLRALKSPQLHLSVLSMVFLVIPLNQIGFKFPIAYYLTVPKTFIDPIGQPIIGIILVLVNISLLLLAYRLRFVPYFAITTQHHLKNNIQHSWQQTRGQNGQFFRHIGQIIGLAILVMGSIFLLQWLADHILQTPLKRYTANGLIAIAVGYFYFATSRLCLLFISKNQDNEQRTNFYWPMSSVIIVIFVGFCSSWTSGKMINPPVKNYLVIAHKGVSSENDAANTMVTLGKVAETKPDYIEIDIQKTKDGVYVLSHDSSIKSKDGKHYKIDETSWHDLKKVHYEENGRVITPTAFKSYIKRANSLQQKLLIELKINTTITTSELKAFQKKYGQYLTQNHAQLQSMNQNAIKRLAKYTNRPIGLLSPVVNSVNSAPFNTFYAIEYSSANANIVQQVIKNDKKLYVWTLNSQADISSAYALGVTGYITDYPKETRAFLKQLSHRAQYANAVWHIVMLQKTSG